MIITNKNISFLRRFMLDATSYKLQAGKKGFTLIELLVVIAIIGILASMAVLGLSSVRARGRDAKRKTDLDTIKKALLIYYDGQTPNKYPIPLTGTTPTPELKPTVSKSLPSGGYVNIIDIGDSFKSEIANNKVPTDPLEGNIDKNGEAYHYIYATNVDGSKFYIHTTLEADATSYNYNVSG